MERARIRVFDTTLRDGEQSPGCSMNVHEKLRLARQLDRVGVDIIEAGFPIASNIKPRSKTHRAIGPGWSIDHASGMMPSSGTRP